MAAESDVSLNVADVQIARVTRIPGRGFVNEALLACDHCGMVPVNPEDENELALNMVRVPDRKEALFLGVRCTEGEITRYVNGHPVTN